MMNKYEDVLEQTEKTALRSNNYHTFDNTNLVNFMKWIYSMMQRRYDFFVCIDGDEGTGKSRGIFLNMLSIWYETILKKEIPKDAYGVEMTDFISALRTGEKFDFRGLDEAGDSLDTQEFTNKFNRMLYQAYTVIREKQYLSVVVLPSFFDLNPRFRKRRVRFLIHARKRTDNKCCSCSTYFVGSECPNCGSTVFKKGFVAYDVYDRKRLREIISRNQFRIINTLNVGVKPLFSGVVTEYTGHIIDDYTTRKAKKMDNVLSTVDALALNLINDTQKGTGKRVCNHEWRFSMKRQSWLCRKCGSETTTNPFDTEHAIAKLDDSWNNITVKKTTRRIKKVKKEVVT